MNILDDMKCDLVRANCILAKEDMIDACGHISVRNPENPDKKLLSPSRSPCTSLGFTDTYRDTDFLITANDQGRDRDWEVFLRALRGDEILDDYSCLTGLRIGPPVY